MSVYLRSANGRGSVTLRWPLVDGNNNTMMLVDSSASVAQSHSYTPYGETTEVSATDTNTQQFAGRENDEGTGLYFNRARYYLPRAGRFISEDPIGWASGQENNYAYVGGDPVAYTDPSGQNQAAGAAVGAEVGAVLGPIGSAVGAIIGAGIGAWIGWNVVGQIIRDKTPIRGGWFLARKSCGWEAWQRAGASIRP